MILDKFNLKGKCGLVTGAGSGIGKGMAPGLAEAGAKVALAGRNMEKLGKVTAEMMAMVGDNQTFSDMDVLDVNLLK